MKIFTVLAVTAVLCQGAQALVWNTSTLRSYVFLHVQSSLGPLYRRPLTGRLVRSSSRRVML